MSLPRRLSRISASGHGRLLLALVAGLGAALSLAPFAVPGLMLVTLVPLLESLDRADGHRSFARAGLVFGTLFYAITLSWLFSLTSFSWSGIPAAVYTIASHVVQLFVALIVMRVAVWRFGPAGIWVTPFAFVVAEDLRSHGDLAMPWAHLGYGLARTLPLAQIADLAGIAGLTAWVVAVNVALWRLARRRSARRLATLALVVVPVLAYDLWRWRQPEPAERLRVAVLQPDIAQRDKWNPQLATQHVQKLGRLTRDAVARGAELVVWPEASLPYILDLDGEAWREMPLSIVAGARGVAIGATTAEGHRGDWTFERYYNSMLLYDARGLAERAYHKRQLVPMTEGMPFARLFGWFSRFFPREYAKLSAGTRDGVLRASGLPPLGSAICYESVFPRLAREERLAGATILVNVTNDAWFGRSFAPFQHAAFPAFRAIEQRMAVARSANTGISALYDTHGRALARSGIFERDLLVADLPWGAPPTVYTRLGDWFVGLAYLVVMAVLSVAALRPRAWGPPEESAQPPA